jgi:two-component system, NtrC family, response regulator HydG
VEADVRVIAATHVDLAAAIRDGRFRQDLFYRLNVIEIHVPPLRERLEDVPLLARHFIERLSVELGKEVAGISDAATRALMAYDWPGNVRQLENAIERAIVSSRGGELSEADFEFLARPSHADADELSLGSMTLEEIERRAIAATLRKTQGNVKEAAAALGIDRSTLYEKLKRYDIAR